MNPSARRARRYETAEGFLYEEVKAMASPSRILPEGRWTAIVAQKDLRRAKSRIHAPDQARVDFARAMLGDTVNVTLACVLVDRVVVACERETTVLSVGKARLS